MPNRAALRLGRLVWFGRGGAGGDFKSLTELSRKTAIQWLDKGRYTAFGPEGRRTRGSQL